MRDGNRSVELMKSVFKTLANQISPFLRAKASPIKMDGRYGNENAMFVRHAELLPFHVWCPVPPLCVGCTG